METIYYIAVDKIFPHPDNPRKELGDLTELTNSIKQNGIFQNLTLVRGHHMSLDEFIYMAKQEGVSKEDAKAMWNKDMLSNDGYTVIIGHRRLAAAKRAGLKAVPCAVVEMDPIEQLETMMVENMQRVDLTPYEQAIGMQLMFDLGSTPEEIAERTGFSRATVNRRLNMAKLDNDELKAASKRQVNIADYDKLMKIDDIEKRNELLKSLGTSNFEFNFNAELKAQEKEKNLSQIKNVIEEYKLKKMKDSDRFKTNYNRIFESGILNFDGSEEFSFPENSYYFLSTYKFEVYEKTEKDKAQKPKKTEAEIEKERRLEALIKEAKELTENAYTCRRNYIETCGNKLAKLNKDTALLIISKIILFTKLRYVGSDRKMLCDISKLRADKYNDDEDVYRAICDMDDVNTTALLYAVLEDTPTVGYMETYRYPEYKDNYRLDLIYDFLIELGYQMSDEELALQDGTHEIFTKYKAKEVHDENM